MDTPLQSQYFRYSLLENTTLIEEGNFSTVSGDGGGTLTLTSNVSINSNSSKTYTLYLWIEDDGQCYLQNGNLTGNCSSNPEDPDYNTQNDMMNQEFSGQIKITISSSYCQNVTNGSLYNVLRNEALSGGLALKYTGAHQDSFDGSGGQNIYHWYATTDDEGTQILEKNNVVFANLCWQMIRTTDTGGVRLLYNGEPTITGSGDNNLYDCSTSRTEHFGGIKTSHSLSGSYYYGDGYTTSVNGSRTTYTLTNAIQVTINTTNASTEISNIAQNYPYTCLKTNATQTCTTLYKVDSLSSGAIANTYESTYRDVIGTSKFNDTYTVGGVGYMYKNYILSSKSMSKTSSIYGSVTLNASNLTTYGNYYFGDGYILNGNTHVLSNPIQGNVMADYPSTWVGKYMCQSNSSSSCDVIYYVAAIDTNGTNPIMYNFQVYTGKEYDDASYKYLFGNSINDNGDGTLEIFGNIKEVNKKDWVSEYSSKTNKYVCMPGYYSYDSANDKYICSDNGTQEVGALRYVMTTTITNFAAYPIYKYGYGITANGSSYELVSNDDVEGTLQYIYNWPNVTTSSCFTNSGSISDCGYKTLSKSHYTCFNLSGECNNYYYINYTSNSSSNSLYIDNGKNVSTDLTDTNNLLYEMLKTNTTNSTIKQKIDTWYQNTLLTNYDNYIDDTIYCNNREVTKFGGWNPNGGTTDSNYELQFREYSVSSDLSCPNTTDKFSISNNDAKLRFKVGLMTSPELNLLNQANARISACRYWLASPYYFSNNTAIGRNMDSGQFVSSSLNYSCGVRPVVSLVSGIVYSSGDGSMANPYVVNTN